MNKVVGICLHLEWGISLFVCVYVCTHLVHTFTHLSKATYRAFRIYIFLYVFSLGNEPTTFCTANTMLYHWATGTHSGVRCRCSIKSLIILPDIIWVSDGDELSTTVKLHVPRRDDPTLLRTHRPIDYWSLYAHTCTEIIQHPLLRTHTHTHNLKKGSGFPSSS